MPSPLKDTRRAVLNSLPGTRANISSRTGIAISTVGQVVARMKKRGEIEVTGFEVGTRNFAIEVLSICTRYAIVLLAQKGSDDSLEVHIDRDFVKSRDKTYANLAVVLAGPKAQWWSSLGSGK